LFLFFLFFLLETTTIPEFSHLPNWWNQRARGLGGVLGRPISTGGEENVLCLRQDRYFGDDIFFHEASHGVAVCIASLEVTLESRH